MKYIVSFTDDDLMGFDVIGPQGDTEDNLKCYDKRQLKTHCTSACEFYQTTGELEKVEEPNGQITKGYELTYSIASELENDTILFKLRRQ